MKTQTKSFDLKAHLKRQHLLLIMLLYICDKMCFLFAVILGPKPEQQAIERGLPQPLLSVLEYFDTDEGQIRYGRACWLAGYIAHILLWYVDSW